MNAPDADPSPSAVSPAVSSPAVSPGASQPVVVPSGRFPAGVRERVLRVVGVVVAAWGAVLSALLAAFLVPLRAGTVPLPLSFAVAAVGAAAAVWFAHWTARARLAVVVPVLAWFVTLLPLTQRTTEGDVVVPGNWVGLGTLLVGACSVTVTAFLVTSPRPSRGGLPPAPGGHGN